jgi:hypothetical protein
MPNELKKFLKSFCLTSIIIFVAFVALNLKGIDRDYDKLFSAIGSFGSLLIAYAAYLISKEQHRATEQKISDEKRKLIKEHCQKTLEAIAKASYLCKKSGKDYEDRFDEAISEVFRLYQSAKIELNDDFADLIWRIHNFYLDLLNQHMDAVKEKRALGGEKFRENHNKESELRKELENLYAKYLSIPKL